MPSRRELANAIRALAMDAVQRAKSGHPGMPMGMADIAEVLWNDHLRHDPADPDWVDRDRFVLSNGHGSMLLYALLHLSGYALPLDELRRFRQFHSMTPGHSEYRDAPGVETTTGPLGQGLANAVGMAIAEKVLAARFNRDGHTIVDHRTWVCVGDGCLMEGISHEACSLVGTLGLGKLIAFYDDNDISIDGEVKGWFTDDTPARFDAYGWHVVRGVDGHDPAAGDAAIRDALAVTDRPSILCCKTVIGFGAPSKAGKAGKASAHGALLGVHLPYLQPFADVNKRTSRLLANLPLIRANLCPLAFLDVPDGAYVRAILGVYELTRMELLRDLYLWAHERSTQEYLAIKQDLVEPDPVRLAYRDLIKETVREVVTHPESDPLAMIQRSTTDRVDEADVDNVSPHHRRAATAARGRAGTVRSASFRAFKVGRPTARNLIKVPLASGVGELHLPHSPRLPRPTTARLPRPFALSAGFVQHGHHYGHEVEIMLEVSVAKARNALTQLIHEAEGGKVVHITRWGKSVAVLVSR